MFAHAVGADFRARPGWEDGRRRYARIKWCAGCARGIEYVGRWTEADAPEVTRVPSVTPDGCNHPTPAVTRTRGVEDAAPYGRVLDVSVRIVVNRCVNAANLHPALGSPERGAVAALCAVTEGLVQRGCGIPALPVDQRRAGVEDKPLRCEWGGMRVEPASSGNRRWRTGDGAPYGARRTFPHRNYAVRHPTEGASGTPPPTGCARCRFQRSREVGGQFGCGFTHPLRCMPQLRLRCRP